MDKNFFKSFYDYSWKKKNDSSFDFYERNWCLEEFFGEKGRVLDVACGSGTVGVWLQKKGFKVTGVDISKVALGLAKKKGLKDLVCHDIGESLPFKDKSYDYVFAGDIIEHLLDPLKLLKEAGRVLRDEGHLIVSTPNYGYWYYRLGYLKNGKVPCTEGIGRQPWKWEHLRLFDKDSLLALIKEAGFRPVKIKGASKRKIDILLEKFSPQIFGSILVVEAIKQE